ncbi:MAG: DUF1858 domain-containing protein [Anaerolineales bacterium]|nr:DUF1858 domain-containing protein [Anaerolineales bacterium]
MTSHAWLLLGLFLLVLLVAAKPLGSYIADVMEVFGIKRVGRYSLRMLAAKAVTVEWAARIHRVPLAEFLDILHQATTNKKFIET